MSPSLIMGIFLSNLMVTQGSVCLADILNLMLPKDHMPCTLIVTTTITFLAQLTQYMEVMQLIKLELSSSGDLTSNYYSLGTIGSNMEKLRAGLSSG